MSKVERQWRPYHMRVHDWVVSCFGHRTAYDLQERNARFLEEAVGLVQANGVTFEQAMTVLTYVYRRPAGVLRQRVGGVMTTLASLCAAYELHMQELGELELERVLQKSDEIREKAEDEGSLLNPRRYT